MNDAETIESLVRAAERLLRVEYEWSVTLAEPLVIDRRDRSLTLRCAVSGWDDAPSVVIKSNHGDDERGFSDWASLQFLTDAAGDVAPHFYAGDDLSRLLVMEDLGASRSLEQVFGEGDEAAAVAALRSLAVTMARLVVGTFRLESRYSALRHALPGAVGLGRWHEAERWREGLERVRAWAEALGVEVSADFDVACEAVASVYANPGPWLAFSHGDPAPSNNHFSSDRARLIDFEYAGYRHALYDLTAWDTLCPLPQPWLEKMLAAFRGEIGSRRRATIPLDEEAFRRAWGLMCAYRALAIMSWQPLDVLEADRPWADSWSRRAALLTAMHRLHHATTGIDALEPLAEFGNRIHFTLRERWPETSDSGPDWLHMRLGNG